MKVNIYNMKGGIKTQIEVPVQFTYPFRSDLIRKAIRAMQSNGRQPYGSYPLAGSRRSGHNWGPNHGRSRVPRIPDGDRAVLLNNAVGGRNAHAPTTAKNWYLKVNEKEKLIAKYSALSQTANLEMVKNRGHKFNTELTLPIVVEENIENVLTTKEAIEILKNLGVYEDVERSKNGIKTRAGRGKLRGRRYITPKSILLVVKDKKSVEMSFGNLSGIDVVSVSHLNTEHLAPGGDSGRLTIYTEKAIEEIRGWKY